MAAHAPPDRMVTMLQGIGGVTFDLDGTLAALGPAKARLWWEALRAPRVVLGWARAVDRIRGVRHPDPRAAAVRSLARELALSEERVDAIVTRAIDRRFPTLYRQVPALAATVRLLEAARAQQLPVAVVSDYPALEKLDGLGLSFDVVIDCNALGALKPLPDGLLAAARQVGVPPCALLHVGDRWDTDGLAAAAAGTKFVPVDALS